MIDIQVASENAFIIYFHDGNLLQKNAQVIGLVDLLDAMQINWLEELIPAFDSVLVTYDALQVDHLFVRAALKRFAVSLQKGAYDLNKEELQSAKPIALPVYYAPPIEHDIKRIAEHNNLRQEQVIELHHSQIYRVFCLGFAPGFGFLGAVDQRIATPRLATPRKNVPAGAVAIADRQTAIYPNASPGGWNILGLCPLTLFNSGASPPTAFSIGDSVRFLPINKDEYVDLGGQI